MTQDEILIMFRQHASSHSVQTPMLNTVILDLAQLLADSRGKLSKEHFETLVRIGGALYKEGHSHFQARADVGAIMKESSDTQKRT